MVAGDPGRLGQQRPGDRQRDLPRPSDAEHARLSQVDGHRHRVHGGWLLVSGTGAGQDDVRRPVRQPHSQLEEVGVAGPALEEPVGRSGADRHHGRRVR